MLNKIFTSLLIIVFGFLVQGQSLTLTSPTGGEKIYTENTFSIKWESESLPSSLVKLEYSLSNGTTWVLINSGVTNNGSYIWDVPADVGDNCLVRLSDFSNETINDVSDSIFQILNPFIQITSPLATDTLNGCETHRITWEKGGIGTYVKIFYQLNEEDDWYFLVSDYVANNSNYYDLKVPSYATDGFRIRIEEDGNPSVFDEMELPSKIIAGPKTITLTSPNGGESWSSASRHKITWRIDGEEIERITLRYKGEDNVWRTIVNNIVNTGSYDWVLPEFTDIQNVDIQIYDYSESCVVDFIDNKLIIDDNPAISVSVLNDGEKIYAGRSFSIRWAAANLPTNYVKIEYSVNNGEYWNTIINSSFDRGSYSWVVPDSISSTSLIRVSAVENEAIFDINDESFSIEQPTLKILTPNGGENLIGCNNYTVTWEEDGVGNYVKLFYSTDEGVNWNYIVEQYIGNDNDQYVWSVPSINTDKLRIQVVASEDSRVKDSSDAVTFVSQAEHAIVVTAPNGGEVLSSSSNYDITWDTLGTVGNVAIQYSLNKGTTWSTITTNLTNTGSYSWLLPANTVNENALVQVYDRSKTCIRDVSDANFEINNEPIINITTPVGGDSLYGGRAYTIRWSSSQLPGNYVKIKYTSDGGVTWGTINENYFNRGSISWTIPKVYSDNYFIEVSSKDDSTIVDRNNTAFYVVPQKFSLLTPNGGEDLEGCTSYDITWEEEGLGNYVKLYYSTNEGVNWDYIAEHYIGGNNDKYSWSVPSINTNNLRVLVTSSEDATIRDSSDLISSINQGQNAIILRTPNGGEVLSSSSSYDITWDTLGTVGNVGIRYSLNKGVTWATITSNAVNTEKYSWLLPTNTIAENALIQVYDRSKTCIRDVSDANFEINNEPIINVTSPASGENLYGGRAYTIRWSSSQLPSNYVKVKYSSDGGVTWETINDNYFNRGSLSWTIPKVYSDNYLIEVLSKEDTTTADRNNEPFSVIAQKIKVLSPIGGETLPSCGTHRVTWEQEGIGSYVNISYSVDGGSVWYYVAQVYVASGIRYYDLNVPSSAGSNVKVKVASSEDLTIYGESDQSFSVTESMSKIQVISPNAGENWNSGSIQTIIWTSEGTSDRVNIKYSINGGDSWVWARNISNQNASNILNTGAYEWLLPINTDVSNVLIQISDQAEACIVDHSDNYFTINNNPNITFTYPNNGETIYYGQSTRVKWSKSNLSGNYVKVEYSLDSAETWNTIIESLFDRGYYDWTPPVVESLNTLFRVTSTSDTTLFDIPDEVFVLSKPEVTVLSPNTGDENWLVSENKTISWSSKGLSTSELVNLEYSGDNGNNWESVVDSIANSGTYIWTIPELATSGQSFLRISAVNFPESKDSNDFAFTITKPVVGVTVPNDGQVWYVGESKSIQWTGLGTNENIKIELSSDSGRTYTVIEESIPNNGQYFWSIPYDVTTSTQSYIKITDLIDSSNSDSSDVVFTIRKPIVTLLNPKGNESWYLGETNEISWQSIGSSNSKVRIEYAANDSFDWIPIDLVNNTGSYEWFIPSTIKASTQAYIRISDENDLSISDSNIVAFKMVKPSIELTTPNGNDLWYIGQTNIVKWEKDGAFSPNVRIDYSSDNGTTWNEIIKSVANIESFAWTVGEEILPGSNYLLRVRDVLDITITDQSETPFTISTPTITVTSPNSGEAFYLRNPKAIRWVSAALPSSRQLHIELSSNNGQSWSTIAEETSNDGYYLWTPTAVALGDQNLIKITDVLAPSIKDSSNGVFSISAPTITLKSPNGGEQWFHNQIKQISWTSVALTREEKVKIEYTEDNGATWMTLVDSMQNSGSFSWDLPTVNSNEMSVRISNLLDAQIIDSSDETFRIGAPKEGDKLETAITLAQLPVSFRDTTSNYSSQYIGANDQASGDVFYAFSIPEFTDSVSFSINANFNSMMHLLDENGNHLITSVEGYNRNFGYGEVEIGKTYYLVVEGKSFASGNFLLNITNHLFPIDLELRNVTMNVTEVVPSSALTVSWEVNNLGLSPSKINWIERISIESTLGENRTLVSQQTYFVDRTISYQETLNRSQEINVPAQINVGDEAVFVVELIPNVALNEPQDVRINNTVVQETPWNILRELTLKLSGVEVEEGKSLTATVSRSGSLVESLPVAISFGNISKYTYPTEVIIPVGAKEMTFTVEALENDLIEGVLLDSVQVVATNFNNAVARFSLKDNEAPRLMISNLLTRSMEGDEVVFTISSDLILTEPLEVFLTANNRSRFPIPASVIIPVGSSSVQVIVSLEEDDIPEVDISIKVVAGAANHVSTNTSILILDNDIPSIELVLETNMVSESGGPYATRAVLRRTSSSNNFAFTANLSADISNTLFFPSSISLAENEIEKAFNVGVIENSFVDGQRIVNLKASIFVNSCGCNAATTSSGTVSVPLTINDNDGPTLTITTPRLTIPEGFEQAGTIRISRNTTTEDDLIVELSSSDVSEAQVANTVVIPAGQAFVDVPITTIDDDETDGNQQVYFQATATDFATGTIWVIVSDQNLPDLEITAVSFEKDTVQAGGIFNYEVAIKNVGFATAPTGLRLRGYLSRDNQIDDKDSILSDDVFTIAIPVNDTYVFKNAVVTPNLPKDYKVIYSVNPDLEMTELVTTNNLSLPKDLRINPDYFATAEVDLDYFTRNVPVSVKGIATRVNGEPAANKQVEVYVITQGIRRTVMALTDEEGNYATEFIPLSGEAGHYIVGASFPTMELTDEQDAFDIMGVLINNGQIPNFKVVLGDTLNGTIQITNLSSQAMTNFTMSPTITPEGAVVKFDVLDRFEGSSTVSLSYTITDSVLSPGTQFEFMRISIAADQGLIQELDVRYYCQAPEANLILDRRKLDVKASQSTGSYQVELALVNNGQGETGEVTVSIPDLNWLESITPKSLSSMSSGDTSIIILKFLALEEVPFNFPIQGSIAINSQNSDGISLPFSFEKVSESTGTINVLVTNQFTYFAEGEPKVDSAFVRIRNYFSGELYAEGYTDTSGAFVGLDIPEGRHKITVSKDRHQAFSSTVTVIPGDVVEESVFLRYQAITFDWSVIPTGIEDQYNITLETTFETHIPMPVVTLEMPDVMPELSGTETYAFNITLTNHGLISAEEVTLGLPQDDPEYEWVTNYQPGDLFAQQSIQVPVIMKRRTTVSRPELQEGMKRVTVSEFLGIAEPSVSNLAARREGGNCTNFTSVVYMYTCNLTTGLWDQAGELFSMSGRTCTGDGGSGQTLTIRPNLTDFSCAACPVTTLGPAGNSPAYTFEQKSCKECLEKIKSTAETCIKLPTPVPALKCIIEDYKDQIKDGAKDVLTGKDLNLDPVEPIEKCFYQLIPPRIRCFIEILETIAICGSTKSSRKGLRAANDDSFESDEVLDQLANNLQFVLDAYEYDELWNRAYFGDMIESDAWVDLQPLLYDHSINLDSISIEEQAQILTHMEGYEIPQEALEAFFQKWNTSVYALDQNILEPTVDYPSIINWKDVKSYSDSIVNYSILAINMGYEDLDEMGERSLTELEEYLDNQSQAVCASVKVQFSQELTMTREAFEGTLEIFNGHPTDQMDSLSISIEIKDEDGVPANGHFEIQIANLTNLDNVTGTGQVPSEEKSIAQFIFIPELSAAPTAPKVYRFGGIVRYFDPYAQAMVSLPLSDVNLTVNPSPNLMLHYFMQRNILSDDALTSPEIEPTIPAELAVMVENQGYGSAVNMVISSAQPEIVENEKGLAIDFELIGSNLQGESKSLGVTNINFGTIPPLTSRIGQWYFTSTLLGKFVKYEAEVVHANSFGNPELSLVKGIEIHELTHSINAYGNQEDGISDFLVNDFFDINDRPDKIYFSQGQTTAEVVEADEATFDTGISAPTFTNVLTVTPSETGWNYIRMNDPGNGSFEIKSVTRGDGQTIPLSNVWLTFVTLSVGQSPQYENKLHFVDDFLISAATEYTIVWESKELDVPEIVSINGAPVASTTEQVTDIQVVFNKEINLETFTYEDLTLTLQGGEDLITNKVVVSQIDSVTFNIDLSTVTLGNGFYNLVVQAAKIEDVFGVTGISGKQVTWTQFLEIPTVQLFLGIPEGNVAVSYDSIQVQFNLPIDAASITSDRFIIRQGENEILGEISVDSITDDFKLVYLSGLGNVLRENGVYEFVVDMPNIVSVDGDSGTVQQSIFLTVDNQGPKVLDITTSTRQGLDGKHVTYVDVVFDEDVTGFNIASIEFLKDGEEEFLRIGQLSNTDLSNWSVGNFDIRTYSEGEYEVRILLSGLRDEIGNAGIGIEEISWVVERSDSIVISNIAISPDLGFSNTDGVTSTRELSLNFDLGNDAQELIVSQVDITGEKELLVLSDVDSGHVELPVLLSVGGNTGLVVRALGENGERGEANLVLFIDDAPLEAQWLFEQDKQLVEQVDSIAFSFNSEVLDVANLIDEITLSINGDTLEGVKLGQINDTLFYVHGIQEVSSTQGQYALSLDVDRLTKYFSGASGLESIVVNWEVLSNNIAPVANAGRDTMMHFGAIASLDGSTSYDENNDELTYRWVAPDGIALEDSTSAIIQFPTADLTLGETYSFLLIVSDGELFHTDNVEVTIGILEDRIFYLDNDGDGYGTNDVTVTAPVPPVDYVSFDDDCDDTDATIYPNAPEVKDGKDNDCDGEIDETPLGLENESSYDESRFELEVFPIPTLAEFNISLISSRDDQPISIKVFNNLQVMLTSIDELSVNETIVLGENYPAGFYTIIAVQGRTIKTIKVVKN